MSINLSHFGLGINTSAVGPTSRSFRPPSWPPPKDWVCIEDKDGNPVSRYGDAVWNLTPWARKMLTIDFGDGPKRRTISPVIDSANAEILRQLVTWRGWGPRAVPAVATLMRCAKLLRKIIRICSDNKVLASDLWRYPAVIDQLAQTLPPSTYNVIVAELERLRDARDFLGFELLDAAGIQRLKAAQPDHQTEQTAYIPPRIWNYVVKRVAECTQDYLALQEQIEQCFAFCVNAYVQNGAVEYRQRTGKTTANPFQNPPPDYTGVRSAITYFGSFADTAQRFGIKEVIERWLDGIEDIRAFTTYLQIVRCAALVDITAFTLMRIDEASSIRWNCLTSHDDPVFGCIPLIQAETTKTDPDDQGLWITSPSVVPAIKTIQSIAKMRLSSVGLWSENSNPALITAALEPWKGGRASKKQSILTPHI